MSCVFLCPLVNNFTGIFQFLYINANCNFSAKLHCVVFWVIDYFKVFHVIQRTVYLFS